MFAFVFVKAAEMEKKKLMLNSEKVLQKTSMTKLECSGIQGC